MYRKGYPHMPRGHVNTLYDKSGYKPYLENLIIKTRKSIIQTFPLISRHKTRAVFTSNGTYLKRHSTIRLKAKSTSKMF